MDTIGELIVLLYPIFTHVPDVFFIYLDVLQYLVSAFCIIPLQLLCDVLSDLYLNKI